MSFEPIILDSSYAGWVVLDRTREEQVETYAKQPELDRDIAYFRENIGSVYSAEQLVDDYRLRKVALGAFGLQDDIYSNAFIEEILSGDPEDDTALVSRTTDSRYEDLNAAFGFFGPVPNTVAELDFADQIIARYEAQEFERAVGDQSQQMRLSLNLDRELPLLAEKEYSDDANWLTILGNEPLRQVFQTALNVPESFSSADIDQQVAEYRDRAQSILGTDDISELATEEGRERVIQNYLARDQIASLGGYATPAATALTLLTGSS